MSKVQLKHTSVHGNRDKLEAVALMKTVFLSVDCLASRDCAITIEFNILGRDRVYGDEDLKRENMRLGNSVMATEIRNNIAVLSA